MDHRVAVGVIPTRRVDMSFPLERALYYKEKTFARLKDLGVETVDVEDVCDHGILGSYQEVEAVVEKMKQRHVNALFVPHVNFGCEGAVGQVARALKLPLLLWGPRDATGLRDGDSQCGLFATGKVLRRMQVPFTYLPTCFVEDNLFERGIAVFLGVANVIKELRRARVLQISTRPESFWSVMCNEGELLERFGIEIYPLSLSEVVARTKEILGQESEAVDEIVADLNRRTKVCVNQQVLQKSAALKLALERYAVESRSNCVAIQCWHAMQDELGIWPCTAGSLLDEIGLPVACETDVHGAISILMADAAAMGREKTFFVDWISRHPQNPKGEHVCHCGIGALCLFDEMEKPSITTRPYPGCEELGGHIGGRAKTKDVSFLRFDGDNGEYSLLLGTAKASHGPEPEWLARMWIELPNAMKFEKHMVKGPYIHHAAVIHEDITPVLYEACTYLPGLRPDFPFPEQERAAEEYLLTE